MMASEFLQRIEDRNLKTIDLAIALLWLAGREDPSGGMSAADVCAELEAAGYPKQNVSRMASMLREHHGTSKAGRNEWRLHPKTRRSLDPEYAFALKPKLPGKSDSVVPMDLFVGARDYIERVADQINKSYDAELWDCTAVMCRRVLETLIIETYEKAGRANEIKGVDGHFMMLNALIAFLERDNSIHLGRNAAKGLKDFKQLGDLSAHNRRFNARRNDIDRIRDGLRVAVEELLHLSGLRGELPRTLVAKITPENRRGEQDWGKPVGKEAW
jgi:hypothetical protein